MRRKRNRDYSKINSIIWLAAASADSLVAGAAVILGGFLGGAGHLVTRLGGGAVLVIMIGAFYLAHADWFITQKLFMSEQIFLFALGLYFAIKGNN